MHYMVDPVFPKDNKLRTPYLTADLDVRLCFWERLQAVEDVEGPPNQDVWKEMQKLEGDDLRKHILDLVLWHAHLDFCCDFAKDWGELPLPAPVLRALLYPDGFHLRRGTSTAVHTFMDIFQPNKPDHEYAQR